MHRPLRREIFKCQSSSLFTQFGGLIRCNACQHQTIPVSVSKIRFSLRLQSYQASSSENLTVTSTIEEQNFKIQRYALLLPVSKSDILIASLGPSAKGYFVSLSSKKFDFSFVSPRSIAERRKGASRKCKRLPLPREDVLRLLGSHKRSLSTYLALYITYLDPIGQVPDDGVYPWASDQKLRRDILEAFNDVNLTWLRERGYSISDLAAWRWILSARLSEVAIARLKVLANSHQYGYQAGRVPVFLILFLLRRRHINNRALRMILSLIWDRLLEQDAFEENVKSNELAGMLSTNISAQLNDHLHFHEGSIIVMVIRLLRRAREVWSAALPSISAIATRYLGRAKKTRDPLLDKTANLDHRRLSFIFNSLLSLLALPSSRRPFRSIISHERAQFNIIRKMAEFQPALNVNRGGYRAVAQAQLAYRKTVSEREWARLKAKSWPPWKESKLGIDSDIGIEQGISRAAEAITRLQEAGYAERDWDSVAKIYAGWDTDNSPTIQTRAIVHHRGAPSWQLSDSSDSVEDNVKLWSARITATRTVSEAWACFLAYRDKQNQSEGKCSQLPYFSMFEKIIFEEKKGHLKKTKSMNKSSEILKGDENELLPGDGKETWPNPGAQKKVYTRTRVPSSDAFLKAMTEDGIQPGGRFLEFLLQHATSLHQGAMHLTASSLPLATRISFCKGITTAEMCAVSIRVFTAYMMCLCRHSLVSLDSETHARKSMSIFHAFQLMDKRKPCYWPPWNSLMLALRSEGAVVESRLFARNALVQDASAWTVMLYWLNQMRNVGLDIQFECFQSLCIGLEKSTRASRKLIRLLDRSSFVDDIRLDESTPAGQRLLQLFEHSASDGVEKFLVAGWQLLRGLPPPDFRRPGESAHARGKLSFVRPKNLARIRFNAEHIVANGPGILKSCFEELVGAAKGSGSSISTGLKEEREKNDFSSLTLLPKLLAVPHPAHLHAFIRVLGLHQDYDGILNVVQWMDRYAAEIHHHQTRQSMNGERAMRTTMVAVRVFLEGSWTFDDDDPVNDDSGQANEANKAAPADTIQQVIETIDRQELWAGWPSDDEVESYIANARRTTDYSDECRRFEETCRDHPKQARVKGFSKSYS